MFPMFRYWWGPDARVWHQVLLIPLQSYIGIQTANFNHQYTCFSKIQPTLMGNGIASWPCNSLLIPATTSVINITPSLFTALWEKLCWWETLLTKRFAEHDNTLNSMMHNTQTKSISFHNTHHISLYSGIIWTVLAHNNTTHQGRWPGALWVYQGVFETLPEERYILCFICLCQSDWLLLEAVQLHSQSGLNRRHTAGRTHANCASLSVCQGFMKAAGVGRWEGGEYHVHGLSMCVSLLYVNLHHSLYLWSECCKLLN